MNPAEAHFAFQDYVDGAIEGLQLQTGVHKDTWGIDKADQWHVDQEQGLIGWTFSDGKEVSAPVQIIGTYNPSNSSFLWAWDHPSVPPTLSQHAELVKHFGEAHQVEKLTTRTVTVTEDEAWEFVAIANRLADANGGYRADAGGPIVFMTFGQITLTKPTA